MIMGLDLRRRESCSRSGIDLSIISAFPNLTSDRKFINLQPLENQELTLRLQNLRGQLTKEFTLTADSAPVELNLGDLDSGTSGERGAAGTNAENDGD